MKRTPLKRTPLKRTPFKRKPLTASKIAQHKDWIYQVDQHTKGRCVMDMIGLHHCAGVGDRRMIEHHHILTKGAYPAEKHNPLNGICCCPKAHDTFHKEGLGFVLKVITNAKITQVAEYICKTKGIDNV